MTRGLVHAPVIAAGLLSVAACGAADWWLACSAPVLALIFPTALLAALAAALFSRRAKAPACNSDSPARKAREL